MTLQNKIERFFPIIRNDKARDILFLFGMGFIVFVETMTTTMFKQEDYFPIYAIIKTVAVLFVAIKLVFFDSWSLREILVAVFLFSLGILVKLNTDYSEPFFWALLVLGARNIEFKYVSSRGIRNSFGINYPCDFAAYIFFLLLSFCYLMKDKIPWWGYLFGLLIAYVLYKFTYARLDCSCIAILSLAFMLIKLLSPHLNGKLKVIRIIICFTIVVMFVVSLMLSYYYSQNISWMQKLNNIFSNRLALGREAFSRLHVNLFGQFFLMVGNGGSTEYRANYFFLDNSFLYVLFRYGIIFTLVLVSSFVVSSYKRRYDLFFIVAVAIIAIHATTAHHLAHVQYNPFFMALFAFFPQEDDKNGEKKVST